VATLPTDEQDYWTSQIMPKQRSVMIATAATAVGINMTFLLPYSMLARGWDRFWFGCIWNGLFHDHHSDADQRIRIPRDV
ncbi:MAG: hypothetical protein AAFP69_02950, partial [Planctomycetota bacterium]